MLAAQYSFNGWACVVVLITADSTSYCLDLAAAHSRVLLDTASVMPTGSSMYRVFIRLAHCFDRLLQASCCLHPDHVCFGYKRSCKHALLHMHADLSCQGGQTTSVQCLAAAFRKAQMQHQRTCLRFKWQMWKPLWCMLRCAGFTQIWWRLTCLLSNCSRYAALSGDKAGCAVQCCAMLCCALFCLIILGCGVLHWHCAALLWYALCLALQWTLLGDGMGGGMTSKGTTVHYSPSAGDAICRSGLDGGFKGPLCYAHAPPCDQGNCPTAFATSPSHGQ